MITPLGSRYGISPLGRSVRRAEAGGWWDLNGTITGCIGAWQGKGAASAAASYVNLAQPGTYNLSNGATYPTWDASYGWSFSTTKLLLTGINIDGSNKAYSCIVRFSDLSGSEDITAVSIFGSFSNALNSFGIRRTFSTGNMQWNSSGYFQSTETWVKSGVAAIGKANPYLDGTDKGTISNANNVASGELKIGGEGVSKIQAAAIYNIDISSYVADLTTAMNAL